MSQTDINLDWFTDLILHTSRHYHHTHQMLLLLILTYQASSPAFGKECCNYHGTGYLTALCTKSKVHRNPLDSHTRLPKNSTVQSWRSSSHQQLSRLTSRSRQSHQNTSYIPSIDHSCQLRSPHHPWRCSTPYRHQIGHFSIIRSQPSHREGSLLMDTVSDKYNSFHTMLQIIISQGSKPLLIKVVPGKDVNTISLSRNHKQLPKHFTKAGILKQNVLQPTIYMWSSHNSAQQPFTGYFIMEVQHKVHPTILPIHFYVFHYSTWP